MEFQDGPVVSPSSIVTTPADSLIGTTSTMNHFDMTMSTPIDLIVPQSSAAKAPKKRKSWGQPLPEPTTSLPPRKRAKTEDEKEQRRIERIKRNRAAAHNSRERKRQEALGLEIDNRALLDKIARLEAQLQQQKMLLQKCNELIPEGLPQLSAKEFGLCYKLPEVKDESFASTPSSNTIDPRRASLSASTPHENSSPYTPGRDQTPFMKEEPTTPNANALLSSLSAPTLTIASDLPLGQTQHSAVMLFDLQCQPSGSTLEATTNTLWARLFLCMMHLNIMTYYKTILMASWALSPTRMTTMLRALTLTSSSTPAATRQMMRQRPTWQTTASSPLSTTCLLQILTSLHNSYQSTMAPFNEATCRFSAPSAGTPVQMMEEITSGHGAEEDAERLHGILHRRSGRKKDWPYHQGMAPHGQDGGVG